MSRIYHYYCCLCSQSRTDGDVRICPHCSDDHAALIEVYHKMIGKWPRFSSLPIDKAFFAILQRLTRLEKFVDSLPPEIERPKRPEGRATAEAAPSSPSSTDGLVLAPRNTTKPITSDDQLELALEVIF